MLYEAPSRLWAFKYDYGVRMGFPKRLWRKDLNQENSNERPLRGGQQDETDVASAARPRKMERLRAHAPCPGFLCFPFGLVPRAAGRRRSFPAFLRGVCLHRFQVVRTGSSGLKDHVLAALVDPAHVNRI